MFTVHEAGEGSAPALSVLHAVRNETEQYVALVTPATADLTAAGVTWIHVDTFTRFVAWTLTGDLSSPATVSLDILAKD